MKGNYFLQKKCNVSLLGNLFYHLSLGYFHEPPRLFFSIYSGFYRFALSS